MYMSMDIDEGTAPIYIPGVDEADLYRYVLRSIEVTVFATVADNGAARSRILNSLFCTPEAYSANSGKELLHASSAGPLPLPYHQHEGTLHFQISSAMTSMLNKHITLNPYSVAMN